MRVGRQRRTVLGSLALLASVAMVAAGSIGTAGAAPAIDPPRGSRAIDPKTAYSAISATVPTPPQPVKGSDGKYWLAYELVLTNVTPIALDVSSVTVQDAANDEAVATFTGDSLVQAMRPISVAGHETADDTTTISPSGASIVWLDVSFDKRADVPKDLVHLVDMTLVDPPPNAPPSLDSTLGRVHVNQKSPIVLGSPLAPGTWLASDGCCIDFTHHRRGYIAINGEGAVPQRYAIDFYKLDDQHQTWIGDPTNLDSYLSYEQPVFAAASGKVVAMFDGLPDQASPGPPPIPPIGDTVGNHVILEVKPGLYLLYAHMKPGSVKVHKGQRLHKGDQIGLIGTSGNSSTPHLHFQVLTTKTFFPSDSVPWVFDRFTLVGHETERIWDDNLGLQPTGTIPYAPAENPGPRRHEMPLDRDIIDIGTQ